MMNALQSFSKNAARAYLQTVVFVDDHIFDQKTGMPNLPADEPPSRKPIFRRAQAEKKSIASPPEITATDEIEQPYHPKKLVGSFAREGITCALYEPPEGFSTDSDSEIFKLCERTDITILDWDFSGDNGAKALDLIASLVKISNEEYPHHTRLISVYTADQSLVAVANKIADRLKAEGLPVSPEDAQCRLRSGATRLITLGKPIQRFGTEDEAFTVKESALAEKLIEEFVRMNAGILPSYALYGLAAIRRNSKRILDRFHGDLDGAFLLHRELISSSEEAFDQLPELLAEEMCAVVEDERLTSAKASKIAAAALKSDHVLKKDKDLVTMLQSGTKARKVAEKLKDSGTVPSGHLRLASLYSSRTQYSSASRRLGFGTVVRFRSKNSKKSKTPWQYAMCLVPACDSLRLKHDQPVLFPFWTVELNGYNGEYRRNGMVLSSGLESQTSLEANGKAGEKLWTDSFTVDKKSKSVVAFRVKDSYKYAGTKRTIEWFGQLKPLHAHRIAREITEGLSRVGVSEAEWLRLLCQR
jgi:hypothetical protein